MSGEYKDAVSRCFNDRADYRRSDLHVRMAKRFIQFAAPQSGERVLDIATGTGFVAIPTARLVGEMGAVVGVDISPGMLEQAAEEITATGIDNLHLVEADAETLDNPVEHFDLITCCNALPYMADVPGALIHWREFLRPGGRLVFNCWSENSYATGRLLRSIAAQHGMALPVIGWDTGTPERCHSTLNAAGYARTEVVVEPTTMYWSASRLFDVFDAALKNPLFGIPPDELARVADLRAEYAAQAQSPEVLESLGAEMGAFLVRAYR